MKKVCIFAAAVMVLAIVQSVHARSDRNVPVVAKYVCSDLCAPNETIYIYDGITDPGQCEAIGGEMYSHQGWELKVVCKVMKKKRCKEYDGVIGEFHFPFQPKNHIHLGCTEDMKPKKCRKILREEFSKKGFPNQWFMNNIGCLTH